MTACGGSSSNDPARDEALALAEELFAEESGLDELSGGMKDFISCSLGYLAAQDAVSWSDIGDSLEETGVFDSIDDLNPDPSEELPAECLEQLSLADFGLILEGSLSSFDSDAYSGADTYGDEPALDALWDACDEGDVDACDELYWQSPIGSEYEAFGQENGSIGSDGGLFGSDADTYGDDPALDALWDACDEGDVDACDELYWQSPIGSEYEAFGMGCAGRGCEP